MTKDKELWAISPLKYDLYHARPKMLYQVISSFIERIRYSSESSHRLSLENALTLTFTSFCPKS